MGKRYNFKGCYSDKDGNHLDINFGDFEIESPTDYAKELSKSNNDVMLIKGTDLDIEEMSYVPLWIKEGIAGHRWFEKSEFAIMQESMSVKKIDDKIFEWTARIGKTGRTGEEETRELAEQAAILAIKDMRIS